MTLTNHLVGFHHGGEFGIGEGERHGRFQMVIISLIGTSLRRPARLGLLNRLQRMRFEPAETKRQQFFQDLDGFPRLVHQWGNPGSEPLTFLAFSTNPEGVAAVLPGTPPKNQ
jgi:hypothetical protein